MSAVHGQRSAVAFAPALRAGDGEVVYRTITHDSTNEGSLSDTKEKSSWEMLHEVESYSARQTESGMLGRRLGVTWKDLTIKGVGVDLAVQENVVSQFNIPKKIAESRRSKNPIKILQNGFGCVRSGQMLLVLGRPGAGCTSLLKVLSNRRQEFDNVTGEVHYGAMTAKEAQQYRGQIVMNTEEELFFPTLTVGQTIDFATRMKVPNQRPESMTPAEWQLENRNFLLRSMGIEHTDDTKVSSTHIRAEFQLTVPGGERICPRGVWW